MYKRGGRTEESCENNTDFSFQIKPVKRAQPRFVAEFTFYNKLLRRMPAKVKKKNVQAFISLNHSIL